MTARPVPEQLARHPFSPARAAGLVTRGQLRSARFQHLMRGAYWIATEPVTHGRRVQAALEVLPASAIVAGRSAMWFWGARVVDEHAPVEVVLDPREQGRARSRDEVTVHRYQLEEGDWILYGSTRVTTPLRTAFDIGRLGRPLLTVPLLDALLRETGTTVDEVAAFRKLHPGARGCRLLDHALTMVSTRSESPRESALRVHVLESSLPRPRVNYEVRQNGVFVARVDLAWPDLMVAVEYDGAYHDDPVQIARDRVRLNNLRAAGWSVIVIDRHQMRNPDTVLDTIARTLVRHTR